MTSALIEKRFEYVLTAAMCQDCGCWEDGYTTYLIEHSFGYTYSAWPDVDSEGNYSVANFNIGHMLDSLGFGCRVETLHFGHDQSVFTFSWTEPDKPFMLTLNLFIDPPGKEFLEQVLAEQYDGLERYRDAVAEQIGIKLSGISANDILADFAGHVEKSKKSEQIPASGPELNETLLCDLLVMAGFRVNSDTLPDFDFASFSESFDWVRAQLFGKPLSLVGEAPPSWISTLEKIRG